MSGPTAETEPLSPWSCFHCRRRKLRCDRRNPCFHCSKGGLDCAFPVSGRMPTRRHDQVSSSSPRKKQAELLGRLKRLEGIVETLGGHQGDELQHSGISTTATENSTLQNRHSAEGSENMPSQQFAKEFGRLTISDKGTTYVGNRIWNIVIDELESIRSAVERIPEPDLEVGEEQFVAPSLSGLPCFCGHASMQLDMLQPLPSQVSYIWEVFVERVDPFIKILHVPTMARAIRISNGQFSLLTPEMTALMFAVSLTAIISLSELETLNSFGEPRDQLLARYTLGVEQALARADILRTTSLGAVQAFTIYLEAVNLKRGSSVTWSLTGMLVRAAESVGLHRDGPPLSGVTPFETEMRRRLWWHICFLDSKVSDCRVTEVSISESIFDTQEPTNLNDVDIYPDITTSTAVRESFTDLSICLIQCNLWRLGRHIKSSMSRRRAGDGEARYGSLDEIVHKAKKKFTEDWSRYFEAENPLHSFMEALVRVQLTLYELAIHHRGLPANNSTHGHSPAEGEDIRYFVIALACIESMLALETPDRPESGKWAWFAQSQVPWPALTTILMQLRSQPWGPTWERAWTAVRRARDYIPEAALKEPFLQPLLTLMAAVLEHRSEELERLHALPDASDQLRRLAAASRSEPESEMWKLSVDRMGFDTSVLEERLVLEIRMSSEATPSTGTVSPLTGIDDLACLSNLEDGWDNIIGVPPGLGPASSPHVSIAAQNNTEGKYHPDPLDDSVDYWLWNEVSGGGDVAWL